MRWWKVSAAVEGAWAPHSRGGRYKINIDQVGADPQAARDELARVLGRLTPLEFETLQPPAHAALNPTLPRRVNRTWAVPRLRQAEVRLVSPARPNVGGGQLVMVR